MRSNKSVENARIGNRNKVKNQRWKIVDIRSISAFTNESRLNLLRNLWGWWINGDFLSSRWIFYGTWDELQNWWPWSWRYAGCSTSWGNCLKWLWRRYNTNVQPISFEVLLWCWLYHAVGRGFPKMSLHSP